MASIYLAGNRVGPSPANEDVGKYSNDHLLDIAGIE